MTTPPQRQDGTAPRRGKATLVLCLKFLVLAPICLVVWLECLPAYTWCLAQVTGAFLRHVMGSPIDSIVVTKAGFLNTQTELTFVVGVHRYTMSDMGHLVTNVAPFLALVLATPGLGLWRRLRVIVIGVAILFFSQALTIVLRFEVGKTSLPYAVGLISITLPFLLWIVFAYWDKLIAYFSDDALPETPKRKES